MRHESRREERGVEHCNREMLAEEAW